MTQATVLFSVRIGRSSNGTGRRITSAHVLVDDIVRVGAAGRAGEVGVIDQLGATVHGRSGGRVFRVVVRARRRR